MSLIVKDMRKHKKKPLWKFEAQSSFPLVCNLYIIKIAIK